MSGEPDLVFEELDAANCAAVADLHFDCLPTSLPSLLGMAYLRAFYRYARTSPLESVSICCASGVPVAGALISHRPGTLNRRLLFATPLVGAVLRRLHVRSVRHAIIGRSGIAWREDSGVAPMPVPSPEMIYLFCHAEFRGRGVGGRMLTYVDDLVRRTGGARYFIRTIDNGDDPVKRFYIRNGCRSVGRITAHGNDFQIFAKDIDFNPGQTA